MKILGVTMNPYRMIICLLLMFMFFIYSTKSNSELKEVYTALPHYQSTQIEEVIYVSTYWYDLNALKNLITIFNITPSIAPQIFESYLADGTAVRVPAGFVNIKFIEEFENFNLYQLIR